MARTAHRFSWRDARRDVPRRFFLVIDVEMPSVGLDLIQGNFRNESDRMRGGAVMTGPRIVKPGIMLLTQCIVFLMVSAVGAQQVPFFVIVHPDNDMEMMSRKLISDIFLKKATVWRDGLPVEPVDLKPDSSIREAFSLEVHERGTAEIEKFWAEHETGSGPGPPVEVTGPEAVALVRQNKGAIAYVSTSSALDGVKLIPLVIPPVAIKKVAPSYSERAARFGIEGEVVLRLVVNEKGKVKQVTVLQGLEYGLTQEAIRAVKRWRFEPATSGGIPVSTDIDVTINFNL